MNQKTTQDYYIVTPHFTKGKKGNISWFSNVGGKAVVEESKTNETKQFVDENEFQNIEEAQSPEEYSNVSDGYEAHDDTNIISDEDIAVVLNPTEDLVSIDENGDFIDEANGMIYMRDPDNPNILHGYNPEKEGQEQTINLAVNSKGGISAQYSFDANPNKSSKIRNVNPDGSYEEEDQNDGVRKHTFFDTKGDVTKSTTDWMDEKGQIYRREVIKEDGTKNALFIGQENEIFSSIKPDGTKFSITENSKGNRWEKSTYSDGSEMSEHFDTNGTLTSRETTRPDGTIFSETYSPDGKLIEKTEQNGKLFKVYQPDKEGNLQISLVLDGDKIIDQKEEKAPETVALSKDESIKSSADKEPKTTEMDFSFPKITPMTFSEEGAHSIANKVSRVEGKVTKEESRLKEMLSAASKSGKRESLNNSLTETLQKGADAGVSSVGKEEMGPSIVQSDQHER